jgi:hypothetical protein
MAYLDDPSRAPCNDLLSRLWPTSRSEQSDEGIDDPFVSITGLGAWSIRRRAIHWTIVLTIPG